MEKYHAIIKNQATGHFRTLYSAYDGERKEAAERRAASIIPKDGYVVEVIPEDDPRVLKEWEDQHKFSIIARAISAMEHLSALEEYDFNVEGGMSFEENLLIQELIENAEKAIEKAELQITALGVYEAELNGRAKSFTGLGAACGAILAVLLF